MFGEIAWFIPLALVGLVVGLYRRRWSARTDLALAGYLLWGTWLAVTAVVFSYMSGIVHSYYAVALAPAVAALVGAGLVDLWRSRLRIWLGGVAVGLACLATAWFGWQLLDRTPGFAPGVGPAGVAMALAALLVLVIVSLPRLGGNVAARRLGLAAAALGLGAALLAPAAYAVTTTQTAYGGGDPHPGPGVAGSLFGGGPGGFGGGLPGGGTPGGFGGGLPGGFGGLGGFGGGLATGAENSAMLDYLVANRGDASWIVAANSSQQAGTIELATGLPVMAMGGFTGSDPTPTLDQLKSYIASGKLRFVLVDAGGFGGGGFGGSAFDGGGSDRTSWVTSTCKVANDGAASSNLYDCAGAA